MSEYSEGVQWVSEWNLLSHVQLLRLYGLWPARLPCPWNSPGKNAGVDSCSLLQGIFPTQGLNPGFPHWRQILYCLNHQGSPGYSRGSRIIYWLAKKILWKTWMTFWSTQYFLGKQSHSLKDDLDVGLDPKDLPGVHRWPLGEISAVTLGIGYLCEKFNFYQSFLWLKFTSGYSTIVMIGMLADFLKKLKQGEKSRRRRAAVCVCISVCVCVCVCVCVGMDASARRSEVTSMTKLKCSVTTSDTPGWWGGWALEQIPSPMEWCWVWDAERVHSAWSLRSMSYAASKSSP